MEQAARHWRQHVQNDTPAAGTVTRDGHGVGVAAEVADVVADESQSDDLVLEAEVARRVVIARAYETYIFAMLRFVTIWYNFDIAYEEE